MEPFRTGLRTKCRARAIVPEATFLALAGDEVVGYAKFSLTAAQPTRRITT